MLIGYQHTCQRSGNTISKLTLMFNTRSCDSNDILKYCNCSQINIV